MRINPAATVAVIFGTTVKMWIIMAVVLFLYDSYKLRKEEE